MMIQTNAIYEGGVFRPLTPLDLPEQAVVSLAISPTAEVAASREEGERQRAILLSYVSKVEAQQESDPQDGLSNRDHDLLIYGR